MARAKLSILVMLLALLASGGAVQAQLPPPPGFADWNDVLDQARGTTLNWYMRDGSSTFNEFIDVFYGDLLADQFNIRLNRVAMVDTVDVVNLVLNELATGVTSGGSVDVIWLNGQHFFTLRQVNGLYGPWAQTIPNSVLVDWDDPAVAFDYGYPVEGYESPWSSEQFHFIYDSARMNPDQLPRTYDQLTEWVQTNRGRFTYIAPGTDSPQESRFVKGVLYAVSGGAKQWAGPWNQDLYNQWSPELWAQLNAWKPFLWRDGQTYPATENELHELFANGEVDFTITDSPAGAGPLIAAGLVPESAWAFAFDAYMIGEYNYVAIPSNATNKAGALVLANLLLEPQSQSIHILSDTGFGLGYAIDLARVTADERAMLEEAQASLAPYAADAERLANAFAPDLAPEAEAVIAADWESQVLR